MLAVGGGGAGEARGVHGAVQGRHLLRHRHGGIGGEGPRGEGGPIGGEGRQSRVSGVGVGGGQDVHGARCCCRSDCRSGWR